MKSPSLTIQLTKRFRQRWKEGRNNFVHAQAVSDWAHTNAIHSKGDGKHYTHDTIGRRLREMSSGILSNGKSCPIVLEQQDDKQIYRYLPTSNEIISLQMKNRF